MTKRLGIGLALAGLSVTLGFSAAVGRAQEEPLPLGEETDVVDELRTELDGLAAQEELELEEYGDPFDPPLAPEPGDVTVGDGIAVLHLGSDYLYYGAEDTDRILQAWGNPPDPDTLGMIFPASVTPWDEMSYGVLLTFAEDGYVDDEDAAAIDYDELLGEMQDGAREEAEERRGMGLPGYSLVGWAARPHYDAEANKLYWAQELRFDESEENTLNYAIRALGRRGVLEMNAIGGMSQLSVVEAMMEGLLPRVEFNPGHRYADFVPGVDEVAAYGIGALIAGKVASKLGLFAVVGAFFLKAWKLIAVAAIAALGFARRLFGRGSRQDDFDEGQA